MSLGPLVEKYSETSFMYNRTEYYDPLVRSAIDEETHAVHLHEWLKETNWFLIKLVTQFSIINTGKESLHIGKWSWALLPLLLTHETHLRRGKSHTDCPANILLCLPRQDSMLRSPLAAHVSCFDTSADPRTMVLGARKHTELSKFTPNDQHFTL